MFFNERLSISHSRVGGNLTLKSGVSLVTVLLLMLVATIAATATYKWLTSEGRSSTSRMLQNEAYQSALAGIESARSWMTFNANETGAIISQYKDKNNNNAPIKLTDRLAAFVRPGQHYDVYLVGVDTKNSTYKLKLLSEGSSRNGEAKHSEVAILNVNGLYQVANPKKKVKKAPIDFDAPYFGGTSTGTQSKFSSIMINGDWQGNEGDYAEKFIVTGNADLTGNNVNIGRKYSCIGGNVSLGQQGITSGGNLFVGGNVTNAKINLDSSVWFDGDVDQTGGISSKYMIIGKSVTLNGTFRTNQVHTDCYVTIGEDFCTTETGRVISKGTLAPFVVERDVWMPGTYNMSTNPGNPGVDNYSSYDKIVLGNSTASKVYIKAGHAFSDYAALRSKKGTQKKNSPEEPGYRSCKDGQYVTPSWWTAGFYFCDPADDGWDNQTHYPYSAKESKEDLYYMYYMPPGKTDVDFGTYTDDRWRLCGGYAYGGGCNKPGSYVTIKSYFVDFSTKDKSSAFTTSSTVIGSCSDSDHSIKIGSKCYRYLNHDGSNVLGSPYCLLNSGKTWQPVCGVTPWFKSKGTLSNDMSETHKPACAQAVYDTCDNLWTKTPACGTNYFIDDPIEIPLTELEKFANKGCDKPDRPGARSWGPALVENLNKCWAENHGDEEKRKKNLYNGEYQVVKLTEGDGKNDISGTLVGKFVIIAEMKITARNSLITAADDGKSFVLLYLKKGAYYLPTSNGKVQHVFIYMNEANDAAESEASHLNLKGTLYFPAAKCLGNKFKDANFEGDPALIDDLSANNVICKKGVPCGPTVPGSSSSLNIDDEYEEGEKDDYYISVAPQLSVTLESQYKNAETVSGIENAPSVDGSFIVLPRIVYITKDAKGKLADYYNIVPLNAVSSPGNPSISGETVSCSNEIPTTGKLTAGGNLPEGVFNCEVSASVRSTTGSKQKKVPFYVVVTGEGGSLPTVSFVNPAQEVSIGNDATIELAWDQPVGAGMSCKVVISVTDFEPEWDVNPKSNEYTVTLNASNDVPKKIFDVHNVSSSDGSVMFTMKSLEGCARGAKPAAVVFNTNSITVERKGLADYCAGPGTGQAECQLGGDYYKMMQPDWPDCAVDDEEWVNASGDNCSPMLKNSKWSCGITGEVSLQQVSIPTGCRVVIPPYSKPGPFDANTTVTLYGSLKAVSQTFQVGFDVTGDLSDDQAIYISVDGTPRSTCTYADYKNTARRADKCAVNVYRDSKVKLSFNPDPLEISAPPSTFNYWVCEEGADCSSNDPVPTGTYVMSVTGSNTVMAHFGETDKHCFFDEFKDDNYYDRLSVECSEANPLYCIDVCGDEGVCGTVVNGTKKWRLMEGRMSDIDYSYGHISLKASSTRGRKESERASIRAVVMSTAQAGKHGELKAQFQVPIEGSGGNEARASVKNSGFILRSDALKSSFLMLNVFANANGKLKARLCLNGSSDAGECQEKTFSDLRTIDATDIIMMSAKLTTVEKVDQLKVKVWPGSWASESAADEVVFALTDAEISGVTTVSNNEYVGYSLAHQNFKIYGIGWWSETYNAQCWDAPPSVSCSFKAAYVGGIVPQEAEVKPWVGLSAWYSKAHADNCTPIYYYNGDDATSCATSVAEGYSECGNYYWFRDAGAHGYTDAQTNEDVKTAKVSVSGCLVTGTAAAWANQGVAAHCGAFWVGSVNECTRNVTFEYTTGGVEGDYYGVTGVANLRDAEIKIVLDNSSNDEVEVYLYSINSDNTYFYGAGQPIYSLSHKTTQTGVVTIPVANLSNVDGFDPERVSGVYVKTSGSARVSSVVSTCPHVTIIEGCSAEYKNTNQKWEVSTEVKNYNNVKTIQAQETSSYIAGENTAQCDGDCSWNGATTSDPGNIPLATNILKITDANPYVGNGSRDYTFSVTLTTDDGDVLTKTCPPVTISSITPICGSLSGGTTIKQGKGLPVFSYGISNCPDEHCGFKVVLTNNTEIVAATENGNGSWNTDANAANTSTALDVGTYKFKLVSTDGKFTECASDEFKVTSSAVTATCDITGNLYQGQTLTLNVSSLSGLEDNQNVNMTWSLTADGSDPVTKTIQCNSSNCSNNTMTAPTAGTYAYSLVYSGQNVCSGNVTIANASDEVSATCNDVSGYPGLTVGSFASITNLDNVESNKTWFVKIGETQFGTGNNCSKNYCEPITMTAPGNVGPYTYYLYFDGQEKCHATLTVNPKLTCAVNKTSITLGENFTFTATYGGNSYNTSFSGNGVTHVNNQMSYTITPTVAGSQAYNFAVSDGSIGSATCDAITVTVGEPTPTASCDTTINVEPLANVIFTPAVTGCGSGCNCTVERVGYGTTKTPCSNYNYTGGNVTFASDAGSGSGNTYKFTITNKKTSENSADCELAINYKKPAYTCPGNQEVAVNTNVTVTPTGVNYCAKGCSYTIHGGSNSDVTGSNYTSGALSPITGETTASTGDGTTYTLKLHNPAGDSTCTFKVKYTTAPTGCTCIAWVNGTGDYDKNCYSSGLNNMNGKCYTMNPDRGTSPSSINDNASDTWWWKEVSCTKWTGCSGGGSGGGGGINWTNNTTLEAGPHTIAKCNGATGSKTTQIKANFADCWDAFSAKSGAGYWNNAPGNCDGTASVTYPVTVTVPDGGTLTLSNCY